MTNPGRIRSCWAKPGATIRLHDRPIAMPGFEPDRRRPIACAWVALLASLLVCGAPAPGQTLSDTAAAPFGQTVGVNVHMGGSRERVDPALLQRLRDAGVTFVRNDLGWSSVERERGVYDFAGSGYDDFVEAAEAKGLRILFILDYGNPLYGHAQAVVSDEGRRALAAFAAAAARRYGGRGHMWEIWNEPNLPQFWNGDGVLPDAQEYALLVQAAAPALREADPSGRILIGAAFVGLPDIVPLLGGIEGRDFLRRLLATDAPRLVDGITAHFYRAEPPESVATTVSEIRQSMQEAGTVLPLWSGEWGYSTYDPDAPATGLNFLPAVSLDRQASYAARMMLTDYELGLAGSVWFQDRDAENPSPGDIEAHWGLLHHDLGAKPAFAALSALTGLIGDAQSFTALALGEGEHGLSFETAGRPVTALWSEETGQWRLEAKEAGVRMLSRDGRDVTPAALEDGLQVRLRSEDGPIYLLGGVAVLPPGSCPGDCRGDGEVTMDELVTGVRIALGEADLLGCSVLDENDDGRVAIDELVRAIGSALAGCERGRSRTSDD
jgi:hypothetical protein